MSCKARLLTLLIAVSALTLGTVLPASSAAAASDERRPHVTVATGQTWVVSEATRLRCLTIRGGGIVTAPPGYGVTLTVDAVETGSALTRTGGEATALQPGTYCGDVILTVMAANLVPWQTLTFPFRQALYADGTGLVEDKSVLAAVQGGRFSDTVARDVKIRSTGEAFNGVYVKDGPYSLVRPNIALRGNGRSDFVGYCAAITATGTAARLVVDGANVANTGVMRSGVVADGGSNVIVKNSKITTRNGQLPADYRSTIDLAYMQDAPWMLGIKGNNRTTNLLGTNNKATYINSRLSSQGWGVLSTDVGENMTLTSINNTVSTGSRPGYGSYAIGGATETFLGTSFDVSAHAAINRGGSLTYADSTPSVVAALNTSLDLRLSAEDLDKGQQIDVTFDGSRGASLDPGNGVLLQVMEDDDPGPVFPGGYNTGVYREPTSPPAKVATWDVTVEHEADAEATFTDATLTGDFYKGMRAGKNMVLTFEGSSITGAISASTTRHRVDTITAANYEELGEVSNTVGPVVNNGVLVTLGSGSRWSPTGTSYLSSLTVNAGATLAGAVTVDGIPTAVVPGTSYTGNIVVTQT